MGRANQFGNTTEGSEAGKPDGNDQDFARERPTPEYLKPKMDGSSIGEPTYYRSLYLLDVLESEDRGEDSQPKERPCETTKSLNGPIDPFDESLEEADLKPAFGVLTVHEQTWTQRGLQLGNLIKSICLAPCEVIQIAVTEWERATIDRSAAGTAQEEIADSSIQQGRTVREAQKSVAREAQSGGASASSSAVSNQSGVSGGGLFWGASASTASAQTTAMTAQFSNGTRRLAADSTTAISQSTAEAAHSLRSRYQTAIKEVSEKEAESLSTRVLVNYNRRHALNILFFEALQTYEVKTALKYWDRCIFIPIKPISFRSPRGVESEVSPIMRHAAQLLRIFAEYQRSEMTARLAEYLAAADGDSEEKSDQEQERLERLLAILEEVQELWNKYDFSRRIVDEPETMKNWHYVHTLSYEARKIGLRDYVKIPRAGTFMIGPRELSATKTVRRVIAERKAARRAAQRIGLEATLEQDRLFLSQQIWLRMSPDQVCKFLQSYTVNGNPLISQVDPHPVGVFGSYLAFRWRFFRNDAGQAERESWAKKNLGLDDPDRPEASDHETIKVGLSSSGVFAEAVLGDGLAAEEISDLYPRWNADENRIPILPPKIADQASRDRHHAMDLPKAEFAEALAGLRAGTLKDTSHIDKVLAAVTEGGSFRNMGGLSEMMKLADKMAGLSADGTRNAADKALAVQQSVQDTFMKLLESDAGKAMVAEYMVPGAGASFLSTKASDKSSGTTEGGKAIKE